MILKNSRSAPHLFLGALVVLLSAVVGRESHAELSAEQVKRLDAIGIPDLNVPPSSLNQESVIPNEAAYHKALVAVSDLLFEVVNARAIKAATVPTSPAKDKVHRRDAHTFAQGCTFGETTALADVAERNLALKGTFLEKHAAVPTVVRHSNGGQEFDHLPDGRGLAIKWLVDGKSQDLLMINFPRFFSKDKNYGEFARLDAKGEKEKFLFSPEHFLGEGLNALMTGFQWVENPANIQYWSMTPYYFGDRLAKFSAKPVRCDGGQGEPRLVNQDAIRFNQLKSLTDKTLMDVEGLAALAVEIPIAAVLDKEEAKRLVSKFLSKIPNSKTALTQTLASELKPWEHYLRDGLQAQLDPNTGEEVCFNVMVQFQTNPRTMPVNDASVGWDERESEFQPFARLRLFKQKFTSAEAQAWCENRQFTPAHDALFKSAGLLNRARIAVYANIVKLRTEANEKVGIKVDRSEPVGDEWKRWQTL